MADNLDSIMQGFINTFVSKATAAIAKSNVGGTGGVTPGAALAGSAISSAAASMASAATAQFPPLQAASNYALATARSTMFGASGTTAGTQAMQMALSRAGTVNSPLDAVLAIQKAQSMGLGPALPNFGSLMNSAATVSNLLPGVGVTGGMAATAAMQQPQNVNLAKLIGINLRDANGMPAQVNDVINQIWAQMVRMNGGTPPSKDMLAVSLMPGNATYTMISNYFGNDEFLKQAIITGLFAKASGAKNLSQKELLRVGVTTPEIVSQSKRRTDSLDYLRSTSGGMLKGAEMGQELGGTLTRLATSINDLTGVLSKIAGIKAFTDTNQSGYQGFAEGGRPGVNKPAIVGERGPEVFIPTTSGYIVPNHMLPQGNGTAWPAFMWEGGGIPHGTNTDIKRWTSAFLTQLSSKIGTNVNTPDNMEAIGRWAQREGGWKMNDAAYNPLNTTLPMDGSWAMNELASGGGVQGYLSFQDGIDATINTLLGNKSKERGYKRIIDALKFGGNQAAVLNAVNKSKWGTKESNWGSIKPVWTSKKSPLEGLIVPGDSSAAATVSDIVTASTGTGSANILTVGTDGGMYMNAQEVIDAMKIKPKLGSLSMSAPVFGNRANGGHVSAGVPYMVGENGPESFVTPGAGGNINYGGVTINIHDVPATMNEETLVKEIQRALVVSNIHRRAASE